MKLLYTWINENETGFIQQKGFHFDIHYRFSVIKSSNDSQYILTCENLPQYVDLWEEKVIKGLTAIVGENGAGKTSILASLYSGGLYPSRKETQEEYKEFYRHEYQRQKKIVIIENNSDIIIVHNFMPGELINKTGIYEYNVNDLNLEEYTKIAELLEKQTVIYLSNSNYAANFNGCFTHGKLNSIGLTPNSLRSISDLFYDKITKKPIEPYYNNSFIVLQSLLRKSKTLEDFQGICDICYYNYLSDRSLDKASIAPRQHVILKFSFDGIAVLINKNKEYRLLTKLQDDSVNSNAHDFPKTPIRQLDELLKLYGKFMSSTDLKLRKNAMFQLALNLIFEMSYVWNHIDWNDLEIHSVEDCFTVISRELNHCKDLANTDKEQLDYYQNGYEEILQLFSLIKNCDAIQNDVPHSDMAYKTGYVLHYDKDASTYKHFCESVDSFARSSSSFVLKYIRIYDTGLSSGERALQNIFSWMIIPPHFDEYIHRESFPLRDDVMLLIDEIDLYMHPEWQRRCLKTLSDELTFQHPGRNIQIVITTHSPLVLSDVPNQNIIYLKRRQAHLHIDTTRNKNLTFGANIHELLKDGFYLSNSLGEYAYEKIKTVADQLIYLRENGDNMARNTCVNYLPIIKMIGDPLLRHKLLSIFYTCYPEYSNDNVEEEILRLRLLTKNLNSVSYNREAISALKDAIKETYNALDTIISEEQ